MKSLILAVAMLIGFGSWAAYATADGGCCGKDPAPTTKKVDAPKLLSDAGTTDKGSCGEKKGCGDKKAACKEGCACKGCKDAKDKKDCDDCTGCKKPAEGTKA